MYAVGTLAHTTSSAHTVCTHTVVPGAWQREHATTHEAPWERHDSATDADFRERNRRCADRPGTLFLAREKRLLVRHRKDDGPLEGRRPVDLQLASRGVKKTLCPTPGSEISRQGTRPSGSRFSRDCFFHVIFITSLYYCLRPSAAQLHNPPGQLRDCMAVLPQLLPRLSAILKKLSGQLKPEPWIAWR